MSQYYLARVGVLSHVGRFRTLEPTVYPRGSRIVVRTRRGLELGEILGTSDEDFKDEASDGAIIRRMTIEDRLLETRLLQNRDEALSACCQRLDEMNIDAVLIDVEHLFDGQSLYFYFLGDVPSEVDTMTDQLAELYEANVRFEKFADTLEHGCGPGCGTDSAEGAGCEGCSTGCSLASACSAAAKTSSAS